MIIKSIQKISLFFYAYFFPYKTWFLVFSDGRFSILNECKVQFFVLLKSVPSRCDCMEDLIFISIYSCIAIETAPTTFELDILVLLLKLNKSLMFWFRYLKV